MHSLTTTTPRGLMVDDLIWVDPAQIASVGPGVSGWNGAPRPVEEWDFFLAVRSVLDGGKLEETPYFNRMVAALQNNAVLHHEPASPEEFAENETRILQRLARSMREHGYQTGQGKHLLDEVGVIIDATGRLLKSAGGSHRFAVAALLGLPKVLAVVKSRDPAWVAILDRMQGIAQASVQGLFQQLPHPDLGRMRAKHPMRRAQRIVEAAGPGHQTMIDIGANYGQICHAFEAAGYSCLAIENDADAQWVLNTFKIALGCRFDIEGRSALDLPRLSADVVVAMNIFRHLLRQVGMAAFDEWLSRIDCQVLVMAMPRWPEETKYTLRDWNGTDLEFAEHVANRLNLVVDAVMEDGPDGRGQSRRAYVLRRPGADSRQSTRCAGQL